jgi:hypothetical protein
MNNYSQINAIIENKFNTIVDTWPYDLQVQPLYNEQVTLQEE